MTLSLMNKRTATAVSGPTDDEPFMVIPNSGPTHPSPKMLATTTHALRHPAYAERSAQQETPRAPARRQSGPDRHRQKAHRGDLAQAPPQPGLRTDSCLRRRHLSSGRLTALWNCAPRAGLPCRLVLPPGAGGVER
jgi:hypothetical protein